MWNLWFLLLFIYYSFLWILLIVDNIK
jgi:hypothetical protein